VRRCDADPTSDVRAPRWEFFRELFQDAPRGRSDAWRQVGLWAVDHLSERLGDGWPERAWRKNGRLPAGMAWAGSHTVAYAERVELALRLELLSDCEGFARVRDPLKQVPREDQIPHIRLQLEVGALAAAVTRAGRSRSLKTAAIGHTRPCRGPCDALARPAVSPRTSSTGNKGRSREDAASIVPMLAVDFAGSS
jgi:hypothetical protein